MFTSLAARFPILSGLLDFIYPPICAGCGVYSEDKPAICAACLIRIDWTDHPLALTDLDFKSGQNPEPAAPISFPLFAAGNYADPLRQVIIQYKFHGVTELAAVLADRVVASFGEKISKLAPVSLVPIPLHPTREYFRGYNQALIFAEAIASRLDLPLNPDLLYRSKKRKPQSRLAQDKRATNIKGVFDLIPETESADSQSRVILVDDVVTSGQTMFEARRLLTRHGFKVVGAISMAHTI